MTYRAFLLVAAMAAPYTVHAAKPAKSLKRVPVGHKVPDFTLKDMKGKTWKFSELHKLAGIKRRAPVVLTFWCTFCHSCRHVEGPLDRLAKTYKGKAAVFALDATAGEEAEDIIAVLKEKKLSVPALINGNGSTADLFGTRVTTTTVVIDAEGVLRYCGQFGNKNHRYAEDALKSVLAGKEVRIKYTRHRG